MKDENHKKESRKNLLSLVLAINIVSWIQWQGQEVFSGVCVKDQSIFGRMTRGRDSKDDYVQEEMTN